VGTMNFSIPDDVKKAFNETFKDENRSAVVTELMRCAIEERRSRNKASDPAERRRRFDEAWAQLEKMRAEGPTFSDEEIWKARQEGRP
jgi:hypothetical protein